MLPPPRPSCRYSRSAVILYNNVSMRAYICACAAPNVGFGGFAAAPAAAAPTGFGTFGAAPAAASPFGSAAPSPFPGGLFSKSPPPPCPSTVYFPTHPHHSASASCPPRTLPAAPFGSTAPPTPTFAAAAPGGFNQPLSAFGSTNFGAGGSTFGAAGAARGTRSVAWRKIQEQDTSGTTGSKSGGGVETPSAAGQSAHGARKACMCACCCCPAAAQQPAALVATLPAAAATLCRHPRPPCPLHAPLPLPPGAAAAAVVLFNCISCMPEYAAKSMEELRAEDYADGECFW